MQTTIPTQELLENAMNSVLTQFSKIGLLREVLLPPNESSAIESTCLTTFEEMKGEPDEFALLMTQIKS